MTHHPHLPIAILGAGPIGLAAAAHLVSRNLPFVLIEAGPAVGHNIRSWSHVRVFSPWRYNMDKAAIELLSQSANWMMPDPEALPTGQELVDDHLAPLSELESIAPHIQLSSEVISVGRRGLDKMKTADRDTRPFSIKVKNEQGQKTILARAVIDATGTWNQPNPIGSGGIPAIGEEKNRDCIYYGIPDVLGVQRQRYLGCNVAVVGSGHSAINTLLDLSELKKESPSMQIHWILRKENIEQVYGGKEKDALSARGALGTRIERLINDGVIEVHSPFYIQRLENENNGLSIIGERHDLPHRITDIQEIVSNTGSRPNLEMLREVRVSIDSAVESTSALAELIDPNIHSCGTVRPHGELELRHPEKDFYIVGSKSYGRAPTFLMATGYEQVRSVVAYIAGDVDSARRVELDLPETGVCSSDRSTIKQQLSSIGSCLTSTPTTGCCTIKPITEYKCC